MRGQEFAQDRLVSRTRGSNPGLSDSLAKQRGGRMENRSDGWVGPCMKMHKC